MSLEERSIQILKQSVDSMVVTAQGIEEDKKLFGTTGGEYT